MSSNEKGSSPFDFGNAFQATLPDRGSNVNALLAGLQCDPAKVRYPEFQVVEDPEDPSQGAEAPTTASPPLPPQSTAEEKVSYELRRADVVARLQAFAQEAGIPYQVAVERAIEAGLMFMGRG